MPGGSLTDEADGLVGVIETGTSPTVTVDQLNKVVQNAHRPICKVLAWYVLANHGVFEAEEAEVSKARVGVGDSYQLPLGGNDRAPAAYAISLASLSVPEAVGLWILAEVRKKILLVVNPVTFFVSN